jgi:hypothetical protein
MISSLFPTYAAALEAAGFGAWHEEASEASPIASLFVVIHVDDQDRKQVLQAFDARELAKAIQPEAADFPFALLQLTMQYPFSVLPACFADVARLLHRLSSLLPVGTFLLSEDDRAICFRSMIPSDDPGLSTETLVATIMIIQRFCVDSAGLIEAVANGQMSLEQALALATRKNA